MRKLGGMKTQSWRNKETEVPLRCNTRKRDGGELKLVLFCFFNFSVATRLSPFLAKVEVHLKRFCFFNWDVIWGVRERGKEREGEKGG